MGTTQTQTRDLPDGPWPVYVHYLGSPSAPVAEAPLSIRPTQTTTSYRTSEAGATDEEIAAEWLTTTRNGFEITSQYDNGHEFFTTKTSHRLSHRKFRYVANSNFGPKLFQGPLVPAIEGFGWGKYPTIPRLSTAEIGDFGSRAIRATSPTVPAASLTQFLGELHEGLPRLTGLAVLKDRSQGFRAYGSEYLNVQFGWKPFVSDIKKLMYSVLNSSRVITQYERDAGRVVRRKFHFPDSTTSSFLEGVGSSQGCIVGLQGGGGTDFLSEPNRTRPVTQEDVTLTRTWFSAAYQYALSTDPGVLGKLQGYESLANHLLGIRLTPDVLWELAPWSWLADWVGTIGQSLSSASLLSSDGLVIRYGYLMRHTVQQRTYRINDLSLKGGPTVSTISHTLRRESKERVRATPYGFSLTPGAFSPQQWAILGALGLTKSPRSLH